MYNIRFKLVNKYTGILKAHYLYQNITLESNQIKELRSEIRANPRKKKKIYDHASR